jgi:hypothetical protein
MLFHELETKTIADLLDAFAGPPLDGEEYRVSFYDDVAQRIAELGGIEQLRRKLNTDDDDRLSAVLGAFSATQAASVDRAERQALFRRFLTHRCPTRSFASPPSTSSTTWTDSPTAQRSSECSTTPTRT